MGNAIAMGIVLLGGVAVAIQAVVNGALSRSLVAALPAGAVSFGVGFAALLILSLITGAGGSFSKLPELPWWQWIGGILGAYYVFSMIFGVPQLGVVSAMAALILGQMLAALALDATGAFGMAVHAITPARIGAVVLVGAGLLLSRF